MGEERGAGRWLVTTPGAHAPSPPESEPLERLDGRLHPRKKPVDAIMCMKIQGLSGN
jgi:hypothetical protein